MKIIEISSKEYVIDLEWYVSTGPGVRKEIASYIKEEGLGYGVERIFEADEEQPRNALDQLSRIGSMSCIQAGLTDDEDASGALSLANIVADITGYSGIFVCTVNADEKWVLAVNNKQVIASTDTVVSDDEATSMIVELYELLSGTHSDETPLICISDDKDIIESFSEHDEDYVELISGFDSLFLSGLFYGDVEKAEKSAKVKAMESGSAIKILAALIILGGGYYGYDYYQKNAEVQRMIEEQKRRAIEQKNKDTGPTDEELLEEARKEEEKWARELFSGRSNHSMIRGAISAFRKTPRYINGWSPGKLTVNESGNASVSWTSQSSTGLAFMAGAGKIYGRDNVTLSQDESTASTRGSIKITPVDNDIGYEALDQKEASRLIFVHKLKTSRLAFTLTASEEVLRREPISGLSDISRKDKKTLPMKKSALTISGVNPDSMTRAYKILRNDLAVVVTSVSIDFKTLRWEIKGDYYEK